MAYRNQTQALMLDIEIKSKDLQIDKSANGLLGRGGYGSVYMGKYKGKSVAVKMLSDSGDIPKTQRNDLRREAKRLRAVCEHPNILTLIGVIMETNNYSLVLEYMHFGTSISFIKNYIVEVPVRVQMAYQIISAMAYLHSRNPPMKHLDLKAENVLINNYFDAKISDFGLSEWKTVTMAFSKTHQLSNKGPRCGTLSHIPPEVFKDINKKGAMEEDVYAFAVTLWEIFSGMAPFANCGEENLIRGAVLNNQRPDLKELIQHCPVEIQNMIQVSWDHKPEFRPTFKELEEKIVPVYNRYRDTLAEQFKYIRAQIVHNYQNDPEEVKEHYECTMHWSGNLGRELSSEQEDDGNESCDAKPSTMNGSFNFELGNDNRQIQDRTRNGHVNEEIDKESKEQAGDGYTADVNYPPRIQANGVETSYHGDSQTLVQRLSNRSDDSDSQGFAQTCYATVVPRFQTVQPQRANGRPDQVERGTLSNNTLAQVPINETNQVENLPFKQRNNYPDVGLSGYVSVTNRQYTPGSQLRDFRGPVVQPASTVLENEPVSNGNSKGQCESQGRSVEEGDDDDDDKLFQGDAGVDKLLLELSITNPSLYEIILRSPEALQNLERNFTNRAPFELENRLSETLQRSVRITNEVQSRPLEAEQVLRNTNGGEFKTESRPTEKAQRPAINGTNGVTHTGGTQFITQQSVLSVDQFSGQTPKSKKHTSSQAVSQQQTSQHPGSQHQQTANSGAVANSVRMLPAPDNVSNMAVTQSLVHQPVVTTVHGQTSQSQTLAMPPIHLTQQKLPRKPFMQTSDPRQAVIGQSAHQSGGIQGQVTNMQPPQMPMRPVQSDLRQNVGATRQNVSSARPASPVEVSDQIRPGETSNRSNQQAANQTSTGVPDPNPNESSEPNTRVRMNQPLTIYHKHAGGGFTTVQMDLDNKLPPNLQIGNKNMMVVNESGSKKKSEKKKKQKCRKSQLTTSTAELSMDHIDMVAIEIGKDWKRLCRQLDMTEADIEHLQFDYYSSGLYEMMYQGIQKWIQRNGRAATVRLMAEALWEIDRDDIALRLQ